MFYLLAFVLTFTSVYALDCGPEVDLNLDTSLKEISILDQDGSGLCYAYVGAQMVEFEMRSQGQAVNVCPIDLSMKAGEGFFWNRSSLSGGHGKDTVAAALSKGVVSRQCTENMVKNVTQNDTFGVAQFASFLELVREEYQWKIFSDSKEVVSKLSGDQGWLKKCDYQDALLELKELGLLGSSVTNILKHLLADCENKTVPRFHYSLVKGNSMTLEKFMDNLLKKKKPVALGLCASALKSGNTKVYNSSGDECGRHEVMAVGKRKKNNRCEVLIRNSWGYWDPIGISCACRDGQGNYYADCSTLSNKRNEARRKLAKFKREAPEYTELKKSFDTLDRNYTRRTMVGCWFPADNIIKNSFEAGGVK